MLWCWAYACGHPNCHNQFRSMSDLESDVNQAHVQKDTTMYFFHTAHIHTNTFTIIALHLTPGQYFLCFFPVTQVKHNPSFQHSHIWNLARTGYSAFSRNFYWFNYLSLSLQISFAFDAKSIYCFFRLWETCQTKVTVASKQ